MSIPIVYWIIFESNIPSHLFYAGDIFNHFQSMWCITSVHYPLLHCYQILILKSKYDLKLLRYISVIYECFQKYRGEMSAFLMWNFCQENPMLVHLLSHQQPLLVDTSPIPLFCEVNCTQTQSVLIINLNGVSYAGNTVYKTTCYTTHLARTGLTVFKPL